MKMKGRDLMSHHGGPRYDKINPKLEPESNHIHIPQPKHPNGPAYLQK